MRPRDSDYVELILSEFWRHLSQWFRLAQVGGVPFKAHLLDTLPTSKIAPENRPSQKESIGK